MTYFEIRISETARQNLSAESQLIDIIKVNKNSLREVNDYLTTRYKKMPLRRTKIYKDTDGKSIEIGFCHSYWNDNNGYQTDWVEVSHVTKDIILL